MSTTNNTTTTGKKLGDFKYLVFDCYGTLIDWETGIYEALKPLLSRSSIGRGWTREEALKAFTKLELEIQTKNPRMLYCDVLAEAHRALSGQLLGEDGKEKEEDDAHSVFAKSIEGWPIFPDTLAALRVLATRYKLVILSNVDRESFGFTHARLSQSQSEGNSGEGKLLQGYGPPANGARWLPQTIPGIDSPLTLILTAQDTGAYKPSLKGFEATLDVIAELEGGGTTRSDALGMTLSVAQSLVHDHTPARSLGMSSVWIDREGAFMGVDVAVPKEELYTWRFETLGEMAERLDSA